MSYLKTIKLFLALFFLLGCSNKSGVEDKIFNDGVVTNITKYKIGFTAEVVNLVPSFPPAIGSSLKFKEKLENGSLLFYSISDRGPNYPVENLKIGSKDISGLICFHPKFSPFISLVEVNPGISAIVIDYKTITKDSQPINGLTNYYNAKEKMLTANTEEIKNPHFGLDTESLSLDKDGNFWIGDEYGPSLNFVDSNGSIIKSYIPGDGLPGILKHRQMNRGFEALDVTPSGKVYAILESALDINSETKKTARFIRMLELDPTSGKVRMFAYPLRDSQLIGQLKIKVSDLAAISDSQFLVAEQVVDQDKKMSHVIYKIDLKDASDIGDIKLANGKDLEYGAMSELQDIRMVKKEVLFVAETYGWEYEKLEGLAIIDNKTIAVANDNDFGISQIKVNECKSADQCNMVDSVPSELNKNTHIWIINLTKPLIK
jgi:hypothetical protein